MKQLFSICLLAILFSCHWGPLIQDPVYPKTSNYFPYTLGQEVQFKMSHYNTTVPFSNKDSMINYPNYPNTSEYSVQKFKYLKDTTIDSKQYAKVEDKVRGYLLMRKDSGIYYQRALDTDQEIIYLKDNLKEGDTWESEISNTSNSFHEKNTFKVLFVKYNVIIDGSTYYDVIGVRRDIDRGVGSNPITIVNYYSAGWGEIYGYYEYPFGVTYGNNKFFRKR